MMSRSTNIDKIIGVLRNSPGLDDDELSLKADVRPRQQVNQICRVLESRGEIRRERGDRGKIVNYLADAQRASGLGFRRTDPKPAKRLVPSTEKTSPPSHAFNLPNSETTLLVIPCSGAKIEGGGRQRGSSILRQLPKELARRLTEARSQVAPIADLDETVLLPAWRRYAGSLYVAAYDALKRATDQRSHVVIISGGYGVVLADEAIGNYNTMYRGTMWARGLLEDVLGSYAQRHALTSVRAFASATTDYGKLLRRVSWRDFGVIDGWLLAPETAPGAMVKSPRAQGEAFSALLAGTLHDDWSSSDGLRLDASPLTV